MRASALTLAAGAVLAGVLVGAVYGSHAGLVTGALLAGLGGTGLVAAHVAAARRDRLGPLRRQFSLSVAIAIGEIVVAIVVFALLMFVADHDALLIIVLAVFAGVVSVRAAQLLSGGVLRDVEGLRDGLEAVGHGDRDVHMTTEARDEVAELAVAANAMVERLAAEEAARRDLVAAVSHDLRTPITSLRLLAEAMSDDIVDESSRREDLQRMRTHIEALSALIDDLFELSRLESGDIQWSMEQVSVGQLVAETVDALSPQAEARGLHLRAELPTSAADGAGVAQASPEKLQRVLFNLIQNAIRHTPSDGTITVRAEPAGDAVEVEVVDTGEGIAARDRDRVFEAFFRGGAQSARTEEGAGLGLAISRAIIEAHGGRIWLDDAEVGTRVRFALPRGP
jgi:signal transduction histidine kinase